MGKRIFPMRFRAGSLFLISFALAAGRAAAALIVYEPFDYPAKAPLLGQTNGFVFSEPWRSGGFNAHIPNLARMKPGPLTYPGLAVQGSNHLQIGFVETASGISGLARLLATNINTRGTTL